MVKKRKNKGFNFLYWTPRVLGILFILFISIFALDVFGENYSFLQLIVALFMHLLPPLVLLALLIIAWKHEWVGAAFILLGVFYIIQMKGFPVSVYFVMSGPAILIGALFLVNYLKKHRINWLK